MKTTVNWVVFTAGLVVGLLLIPKLIGTLFILGNHDTFLEIMGILAYGLVPIPASLIALWSRTAAALCFAIAGGLWIAGVVSSQLYLQNNLGQHLDVSSLSRNLTASGGLLFAFSLFYVFTEIRRWPRLHDRVRLGEIN
jgi:hypothetical protein